MKKLSLAITFGIISAISASAQVKPNLAKNHTIAQQPPVSVPGATRARVTQPTPNSPVTAGDQSAGKNAGSQWGNASLTNEVKRTNSLPSVVRSTAQPTVMTPTLSQTYRVGVGDILDIQIPDSLSTRSTLFTVTENGTIDYPLAGGPIQVNGLTAESITARLKASIRVIDASTIMVKVRDFASHSVNVIGFVQMPGAKVLRREAVPLYVVLAEAAPLKEATSVTVVRNGQNAAVIDLHNPSATNHLILPGDVIKVSDRAVR